MQAAWRPEVSMNAAISVTAKKRRTKKAKPVFLYTVAAR